MAGPVTLPLHCPHCGGPISVEIEPTRPAKVRPQVLKADPFGDDLPEADDPLSQWPCPHCGKLNHGQLGGMFRRVTKGH